MISPTSIHDIDKLPSLGPGEIAYSSSGRIINGHWVEMPLVIAGRSGMVCTKAIAVLTADSSSCTATARRSVPEQHPTHVVMFGICFGRAHDKQPGGAPDHNLLLNLASGGQRSYVMRRGTAIGAGYECLTTARLDATTPGDLADTTAG